LLILNPDCLIDTDGVGKLREAERQLDTVGVLGVRVVDATGEVEGASRRHDPTLGRALNALLPGAHLADRNAVNMTDAPSSAQAEHVDAISGACMYLPRSVFDAVGGFDEGYFLHCEDLDLCRRVRDAGYAVYYLPTLSVRHDQGSSSYRRPLFVSRHKHRSMWRYFRKFDPAARNRFVRAMVWLGIWTHFALRAPFDAWRQGRS
jgi:GT2 family glycosyltransferase